MPFSFTRKKEFKRKCNQCSKKPPVNIITYFKIYQSEKNLKRCAKYNNLNNVLCHFYNYLCFAKILLPISILNISCKSSKN